MTESTGVRVTALLLGQDSFRDERGRAHVIGIFDTVGAQQFPMAFQFSIYCRLHGEGSHELILRVLDPNGMEIVRSEPITANLLPHPGPPILHEHRHTGGVRRVVPGAGCGGRE